MKRLTKERLEARRGTFIEVAHRGADAGSCGAGASSSSSAADRREMSSSSSARQNKSDMKVNLDRDSGRFLAGEIVKGSIAIILSQEVRVKDLTLRFFGDGRVSWNERRSYIKGSSVTVNLKNTDVFLDQTISILWKGSRNSTMAKSARRSLSSSSSTPTETEMEDTLLLPAGVHSFPFQYKLPSDLPASSFEGRWGQVRYTIKAVIQRPWKFDIEREKDFVVIAVFDLNDEPELARPIGGIGDFSPGIFCIRNGQVTTELRIGRRGYAPGERITFHVEIENNSRQKLHHHRVALVQHVTFRASTKVRKLTTCVGSVSRGEVLPGASSVWTKDSLSVPVLPPTSNKNYRNIQIKYTLSLFICHSSWADEFCLPVTVVIGTSGLKQETINNYLSMLGYSGPSPKPSRRHSHDASTSDLSGSTLDSSGGRSSSKYMPRSSLQNNAPTDTSSPPRSPSNGSLQLSPRLSKSTCTTDAGHASSTNAIHGSLDLTQDSTTVAVRKKDATATVAAAPGAARGSRPSSFREAFPS